MTLKLEVERASPFRARAVSACQRGTFPTYCASVHIHLVADHLMKLIHYIPGQGLLSGKRKEKQTKEEKQVAKAIVCTIVVMGCPNAIAALPSAWVRWQHMYCRYTYTYSRLCRYARAFSYAESCPFQQLDCYLSFPIPLRLAKEPRCSAF